MPPQHRALAHDASHYLLQPAAAGELGARKAESVQSTGAPLLISANPGCSLQIDANGDTTVLTSALSGAAQRLRLIGYSAGGTLRYDRERGELVSEQAGLAYQIRDGIPIMLPDEARRLDG